MPYLGDVEGPEEERDRVTRRCGDGGRGAPEMGRQGDAVRDHLIRIVDCDMRA